MLIKKDLEENIWSPHLLKKKTKCAKIDAFFPQCAVFLGKVAEHKIGVRPGLGVGEGVGILGPSSQGSPVH